MSPGQQVFRALACPLHLSHLHNSQKTSRVLLREGQAGPVTGQSKVNTPKLWVEPLMYGTWEPSTVSEDGAIEGWSGQGLGQPTLLCHKAGDQWKLWELPLPGGH